MKQTNLSVFIPHAGCPHTCSFCNQRYISGAVKAPTAAEVERTLSEQQPVLQRNNMSAEIAFFGGSFTAILRDYMTELLQTAYEFCRKFPEQYNGIRCSTRPDCIDRDTLEILKSYGMTAIELGAQSMSDEVLSANSRGHTAEDVRMASRLIKEYGFSLGLQMMTGLYKDTAERVRFTADEFIKLAPDTMRVYPTVILENTDLAALYKSKKYITFGFEETVDLCAELLRKFEKNGIKVIRLGLHASETLEAEMLGGVYHPAFREICESRNFLTDLLSELQKYDGKHFEIYTDGRNVSKLVGQKKSNILRLSELGYSIKIHKKAGEYLSVKPFNGGASL